MKIDLYTDIACPWCLLGHHRLDTVTPYWPGISPA